MRLAMRALVGLACVSVGFAWLLQVEYPVIPLPDFDDWPSWGHPLWVDLVGALMHGAALVLAAALVVAVIVAVASMLATTESSHPDRPARP